MLGLALSCSVHSQLQLYHALIMQNTLRLHLQASTENSSNLAVYALAFFLTTLGIVYVQEAERKIPMNYASRYRVGSLGRQSYLPFKVCSPT